MKMSLEEATMKALYDELDDTERVKDVEGIIDDVLVVTDPEISSEEYNEVIERAQEIIEDTPEGDIPLDDDYIGEYLLTCPICGNSFVNDEILEPGATCPICLEVPEAFVVKGRLENEEDVFEDEVKPQEEKEDDTPIPVDEEENEEEEDEQEKIAASEQQQTADNKLEESKEVVEESLEFGDTIEYKNYVAEVDEDNFDNNKESLVFIYKSKQDKENGNYIEQVSLNKDNLEQNIKEYIDDTYIKDTVEESLEKDDVDGWGETINEVLSGTFNDLERIMYEVRNCVRGSYTHFGDTVQDLINVLRDQSNELEAAAKQLESMEQSLQEDKEIKTEVEKKIDTKVLKLDDNVEIEIEVDVTPGFEKTINKIWYTDWDGTVGFGYDSKTDEFVGFDNPNGSFLTSIEDEQIKDEIHKILNEKEECVVTESITVNEVEEIHEQIDMAEDIDEIQQIIYGISDGVLENEIQQVFDQCEKDGDDLDTVKSLVLTTLEDNAEYED